MRVTPEVSVPVIGYREGKGGVVAEPAAGLAADHGRLLVVDDEPFLRDAVAASLTFLGFQVTTADTAPGRSGWPGSGRSTWSCST
jgi:hypothetical protein